MRVYTEDIAPERNGQLNDAIKADDDALGSFFMRRFY